MSTNTTISDHDVILAIPGEADSVRLRLVKALERLGYKVLAEQPIQARRAGQSCANWDCSLNALDYRTNLTISLKQTNDVAVLATFNYEIKSYMHMTKGDRQTLGREAEALAALATERLAIAACTACGTPVNDESHFCRRCGAPLVVDLPELEVLRLTKGTRGSYHNIFVGLVALMLAALTSLPLFIVNGARIWAPLFWVGMPLGAYGLFVLGQGLLQLHRTLNPKTLRSSIARLPTEFPVSVTTALPFPSANGSITEGTTELLFSPPNHREPEPIRKKDRSTAEIENERLM